MAESLFQLFAFVGTGEIDRPIAGKHAAETAQMFGHLECKDLVSCSAQMDFAAVGTLCSQHGQHLFVVRQDGDIQIHALGDLRLEVRFSLEQPGKAAEQIQGVGLYQREKRLQQQVGLDQGTVEVYAKRYCCRAGKLTGYRWI